MTAWVGPGVMQIDGVRNCGCTCYRPYAGRSGGGSAWEAVPSWPDCAVLADGQRDVTGRAGLMVSRTAPVHEGRTRMLRPPAPGRRIQQ